MKLSELHTGERGVIVKVYGHGGFRKRIVEMGFVKGKAVKVILNAPLRDPIEYEIMGYKISLRREEANLVEVISESEAENDARLHPDEDLKGLKPGKDEDEEMALQLDQRMARMAADKRRVINVALVGNPNCGKTSLFNVASGGHEHVGNYSGVTVDAKEGFMELKVKVRRNELGEVEVLHEDSATCGGACAGCATSPTCTSKGNDYEERSYHFRLVDLPGTYSLSAYSPEELYVRRHLIDETPDVVINVVDSSNLERNLYLTTQLIDMHQRMVIALNMFDELQRNGDKLDYKQLGTLLGVPMVPTISRTGVGIRNLFEMVIAVYENQSDFSLERHIHVNHGAALEHSIDRIKHVFQKNQEIRSKYSTRYLAIKFLEGDTESQKLVETLPQHDELVAVRYEEAKRLKEELHDSPDNAITDAKYGFIQGALKETYQPHVARQGRTLTEKIDGIVTNRYLGFPLFFVVLFLIFYITFQVGAYPMDWIDWLVAKLSEFINYAMPDGMLKDMIVDGAISGVGAVIVFLPNIMILYLFISILEDSGYMARAAFIMDKLMHKMGLHGKSFIPMVMGNIIYIDKEKIAFKYITNNDELEDYIAQHFVIGKHNYILIDEVQDIAGWEHTVRSYRTEDNTDIIVTGSNSKMLSSELSTLLAGRYVEIRIQSLSYTEFMQFHNLEDTDDTLWKYMTYGGLPGLRNIGLENDDMVWEYLSGVFNTIMLKDIIERHKIRNIPFLNNLITFMADTIGKLISASSIVRYMKSQGEEISTTIVLSYTSYFAEAFLTANVLTRVRDKDCVKK